MTVYIYIHNSNEKGHTYVEGVHKSWIDCCVDVVSTHGLVKHLLSLGMSGKMTPNHNRRIINSYKRM